MMKYILLICGALTIASGLTAYFLYKEVGKLEASLATEKANVATLTDKVKDLNKDLADQVKLREVTQALNDNLVKLSTAAVTEATEQRNYFDSWRSKLDGEMHRRPEVVARAAGLSLRRSLLDIEQASRGEANPTGDGDIPPGEAQPDRSPEH